MDRITTLPNVRGGRPTIRGMRITVAEVLEMLGSGMKEADILEAFPYLEAEDIEAALAYGRAGARTTNCGRRSPAS